MDCYRVSKRVNNARNDSPDCITAVQKPLFWTAVMRINYGLTPFLLPSQQNIIIYSAIFVAWGGGAWRSRNRSLEGLEISIWYRLLPVASHKSYMPNHSLLPPQQNMLRIYEIFVAG
jgi:hypothetical protein